jgi:hypothetical protein
MTFDSIRLPASAIADLYRQSLVVVDEGHSTPSKIKSSPDQPAQPAAASGSAPLQQPAMASQQLAVATPLPAAPSPLPLVIRYTGGFGKKISVVVNHAATAELPAAEQELLHKLMAACKLVATDFAIINLAVNQPAARQLWHLMPARAMLLFGVDYHEVGVPFTQAFFQVKEWSDAWFLSAPSLSQFAGADTPEQKALKRELWNGLQKIFLGK